jgi:hypothetical protein
MLKAPGIQKARRSQKFKHALGLMFLAIYFAGSLPGKALGAEARAPKQQQPINIYLPVLYVLMPGFVNPGFEGGYTGWMFNSNQGMDIITQAQAHSGNHSAGLGNGSNYRVASISQRITVHSSYLALWYWIYISSADACGWDFLKFYVNNQLIFTYDICASNATNQWVLRTLDLSAYAGQTITLKLEYTSDETVPSTVYVDDFHFTLP